MELKLRISSILVSDRTRPSVATLEEILDVHQLTVLTQDLRQFDLDLERNLSENNRPFTTAYNNKRRSLHGS